MLVGVLRTDPTHNAEIMARGYVVDAVSLNGEVDITPDDPYAKMTFVRTENALMGIWDNEVVFDSWDSRLRAMALTSLEN